MRGQLRAVTVRPCLVDMMTGCPICPVVMRHGPPILRLVSANGARALNMTIALTVTLADLIPRDAAQCASDQCAVPAANGVSDERTCAGAECGTCNGVG